MITFLIIVISCALIIMSGILYYQHRHITEYTDEKGVIIDLGHNPLSQANIHTMSVTLQNFIKAEIKTFLLFTLRLLIKIRKISRNMLDRGIHKIAHIIFKDNPEMGPIEENNLLYHVEEHKKTGEKGQIHL